MGFGGKNRVDFNQDFIASFPTLTLCLKDGSECLILKNGSLQLA
jgi:hypothetical protein